MKIACLQFDSKLGAVQRNIAKATSLLETKRKGDFDLLVLPELAFSGYNFPSHAAIVDYLETPGQGPSSEWARETAKTLDCVVAVGYPEKELAITPPAAPLRAFENITPEYSQTEFNYNSLVVYSPSGHLVANYRKSFLYYTEATWAREGQGFSVTIIDGLSLHDTLKQDTVGSENALVKSQARVSFGICMDINPKNFEPLNYDKYEFASHIVDSSVDIAILSMAWLSFALSANDILGTNGLTPETDTWSYWFQRFLPVLKSQSGREVVFVMANRCGVDRGAHSRHGELCKMYEQEPKIVEFIEAVRAGLQFSAPEQWEAFGKTLLDFSDGHLTYEQMREQIIKALNDNGHRRTNLVQLFESVLGTNHEPISSETIDPSQDSVARRGTKNAMVMAQMSQLIEKMAGIIVPDVVYAGSSMVWTSKDGQITVHGYLGKGEEGCLTVDPQVKRDGELQFRLAKKPEDEETGWETTSDDSPASR